MSGHEPDAYPEFHRFPSSAGVELPNWTIRLSHSPHLSVYPFTWSYNPDIVIVDPRSQLGCSEPANSLLPFS